MIMLSAALVLIGAAWLRGAEYDEQYTLFLTAGVARPDWPETVFPAGRIASVQAGQASFAGITRDLRATDVHPPLYFWTALVWRVVFGPSLFAVRTLSVLCGMVSLALVGIVAGRLAIPKSPAMLLMLGCYGFVYTNAIARGFAVAQMLTLFGVVLMLERRPSASWGRQQLLAGVALGAACCCNYLAVFVAIGAVLTMRAWRVVLAMLPFLALNAWFFSAQYGARPNQFPPFEVWPSLVRLAEKQVVSVFGGLPLYAHGFGRMAIEAGVTLIAAAVVMCVVSARPWTAAHGLRPVLAAAVAPAIGLLLLGAAFDNTPIELRYLSFGLPFVALLVAWACRPYEAGGDRTRKLLLVLILGVQLASITGLLLSPRTMQPAQAAAIEAARFVGDGVVLVPRGNDGVGIVGAFASQAPPSMPLLLVGPDGPSADILASYRRVVVALLAQDRDSAASVSAMRAALAAPIWRRVAIGSNLEVYDRTGEEE